MTVSDKQRAYELYRAWFREAWERSDAEDWCARKEVEPGTYKRIGVLRINLLSGNWMHNIRAALRREA
jgi:hypothetical protein